MFRKSALRAFAQIALAAITVVSLSGATYERAMRRRALTTIKMPGRLVDVGGGRRIQIDCRGSGSPTVVLESGLDANGSMSWALVQGSIARTTRVCAYSRAGIMWSDPSPGVFSSAAVASDLYAALTAAGESAPWVVVGHSLGGPYVLAFTARHRSEVSGIVLVDATHPAQFEKYRAEFGKSLQPAATLVAVGDALAWTGLVRLLPLGATPPGWPSDVSRSASAFLPTSLRALRRETDGISATLAAAAKTEQLGDRPLVVLSAGVGASAEMLRSMGLTPQQGARLADLSRSLRADEATWSSNARLEVVADASHYIQFDRPDAVIRAARAVVSTARSPLP